MIPTPEMIEKAAKAMHESIAWWAGLHDFGSSEAEHSDLLLAARAALLAVLPDVVEVIERKPETCADARCAAYTAGLREARDILADAPSRGVAFKEICDRISRKENEDGRDLPALNEP